MSTQQNPKRRQWIIGLGLGLLVAGAGATYFLQDRRNDGNELTAQLVKQLKTHESRLPADLVYVHLDRSLYQPGEKIWFQGYLRNASDLQAARWSEILHVELLDPSDRVLYARELVTADGVAGGDFQLPENLNGGIYKVKAYSNWQKNEKNPAFFEKEIQVQRVVLPNLKLKFDFPKRAFGPGDRVLAKIEGQSLDNKPLANQEFSFDVKLEGKTYYSETARFDNDGNGYVAFDLPKDLNSIDGLVNVKVAHKGKTEAISRNIPILLKGLKVGVFPEGGNLVAGLDNRVAFEAVNEFGRAADVAGVVLDEKGAEVAAFNSFHHGRGAFNFKPESGRNYSLKISKPAGVAQTYALPKVEKSGVVLSADASAKGKVTLKLAANSSEYVSLVAQMRGKVYHTEAVRVSDDPKEIAVSTENFPMGVAQFTVFDGKGTPLAERLVFVNQDNQMKVSVKPSKDKYLPREKVDMAITTTDSKGKPVPANLSMAVVDDKLLAFADDREGNILSKLLLEPEITGKVEEAKFYFDAKEADAPQALDQLLMTRGWRRYSWKEVTDPSNPPTAQIAAEQAVIEGFVKQTGLEKGLSGAVVTVQGTDIQTKTLPNGAFKLRNVKFDEPVVLAVAYPGTSGATIPVAEYTNSLNIELAGREGTETVVSGGTGFTLFGTIQNTANNVANANANTNTADKNKSTLPNQPEQRLPENNLPNIDLSKPAEHPEIADLKTTKDVLNKDNNNKAVIQDLLPKDSDLPNNTTKLEKKAIPTKYYRAKEFAAPVYQNASLDLNERTDFRPTAFWNGNIKTDDQGRATVSFYNTDAVTAFRATVEGIGKNGEVGHNESTYISQGPVDVQVSVPATVTMGDRVLIPVTLTNNTNQSAEAQVTINVPAGLKPVGAIPTAYQVPANSSKTYYVEYTTVYKPEIAQVSVKYSVGAYPGGGRYPIEVVEPGFPQMVTLSGNELEREYKVNMTDPIDSSFNVAMEVFPSPLAEIIKGLEGMIHEPNGCFEQTTSSNYPNIAILQYLRENKMSNPALEAKTADYLEKGYEKLISFETKGKGFELFGNSPGNEALTAYALVQFNDMSKVYSGVDPAMVRRTREWLYSRRDGEGGFENGYKNGQYGYGSADQDITNAYIVYSLATAGYKDMDVELKAAQAKALKSGDPYQLALVANAYIAMKQPEKATPFLQKLAVKQGADGSWAGAKHSFIKSEGDALKVETTSLAVMAFLGSANPNNDVLHKAMTFVVGQRSGFGHYGNTQSTVLALKATTQFSKFSKRAPESGTVEVYVDGAKAASKKYEANQTEKIGVKVPKHFFKPGEHKVKVKFAGTKFAMPYTMRLGWRTLEPAGSGKCKLDLKTALNTKSTKVGETVRLNVQLTNKTQEQQSTPMAIVGIPGGLTLQPWQLKEMKEKSQFAYYEIKGDQLILYFYNLKPGETKDLNFDLRADVAGEYRSPASNAYLYYNAADRCWTATQPIKINS